MSMGQWQRLGLILLGGMAGTAFRILVQAGLGVEGWPWGTFSANLSGAFLLGVVSEVTMRSTIDQGRRSAIRYTFGTGVLGSFTTYSALAAETVSAGPLWGPAYAFTTVIGGVLAAATGVRIGRRCYGGTR